MLILFSASTKSLLSVEMGEGWMQSALVHVLVLFLLGEESVGSYRKETFS